MQVKINFSSLEGSTVIFTGELLEHNDRYLKMVSSIPPDFSRRLSERWWAEGLLHPTQQLGSVYKWYFYHEYFNILEYRDLEGNLAGYYSDIATPLQEIGGEYYITDLILDLWLSPDLRLQELDWDEWDTACAQGVVPTHLQEQALRTMERLRAEVAAGRFPSAYIQ
jgi:hypothetical protein